MRKRAVLTLAMLVVTALVAACGGSSASPSGGGGILTIGQPWVRPAAAGMMTAAYFTVTNGTFKEVELTGATSPVADVGVHETTTDASGMMGMHEVPGVKIPAGGQVEFKPGSYHLMLTGLKQDLKAGDTVRLEVVFSDGTKLQVDAPVKEG